MAVKEKKAASEVKRPVGRPEKYTPEIIKEIGDAMLEWSRKPDSLFMEGFTASFDKYLVDRRLFPEWEKTDKEFSDKLYQSRSNLLTRMKQGSASKAYDGNFISKILPLSDPEYKEWRMQELKLAADNAKDQTVTIRIDSDRMPEQK